MSMHANVTVDHVRELMRTMHPDTDDGFEHPLTAVGTDLLAAGVFGICNEEALVQFTSYPKPFIAAILFNLGGNRLLNNGKYDCSEWLSPELTIDGQTFWDHVEVACGDVWLLEVDFRPLDPCRIYWKHRRIVAMDALAIRNFLK
jgi:hypothetical protein